MNNEELERAFEFILNRQAVTEAKLELLTDNVNKLTDNVHKLSDTVDVLRDTVDVLRDDFREIVGAQGELREDVNRLVDIVENTRDFAMDVARLAVASERRISFLEGQR